MKPTSKIKFIQRYQDNGKLYFRITHENLRFKGLEEWWTKGGEHYWKDYRLI